MLGLPATGYKHPKGPENGKRYRQQQKNEALKLKTTKCWLDPIDGAKISAAREAALQASSIGVHLLNNRMTPGKFQWQNPSKGRHLNSSNQWILTRSDTATREYPPSRYSSPVGLGALK
jgi:hypothetical protein